VAQPKWLCQSDLIGRWRRKYHPRRTAERFHLTSRVVFILSVLVNEIQIPL
jgi:hypothetical protein